jgi:hypothetical protein
MAGDHDGLGGFLGVLGSVRWRTDRLPRFVVGALHRNVTLLAIAFVVVHVVTTVADGYAPIGLKDALVPFVSRYRPVWLGLGATAFDLLLALVATSLLRARLGYRAWRIVHWLAYASLPVALLHALGTGSDARQSWLALVGFACIALVGCSVVVRVTYGTSAAALRAPAIAAALVVPILVFAWYHRGPGQTGWAARAGTPAALLRSSGSSTALAATASTSSSRCPSARSCTSCPRKGASRFNWPTSSKTGRKCGSPPAARADAAMRGLCNRPTGRRAGPTRARRARPGACGCS